MNRMEGTGAIPDVKAYKALRSRTRNQPEEKPMMAPTVALKAPNIAVRDDREGFGDDRLRPKAWLKAKKDRSGMGKETSSKQRKPNNRTRTNPGGIRCVVREFTQRDTAGLELQRDGWCR